MQPIQVDAVLLRQLLPDLRLRVGAQLAGRVLERSERHGLLSLAGTVLVAELPDDVETGRPLRLGVQEVGADRVVLRVLPEPAPSPAPAPAPPPAVPLPLPGGAHARVTRAPEDDGAGGPGTADPAGIRLRYDSPRLGRIDLRLTLAGRRLEARVEAPAGGAHELAATEAPALRAALARAVGVPVDVRIDPRHDRVDVRA